MKFRDEIGQGASRTSPRRPGRYGAAYTEAEEDALIVFLAGKKEPDASWADFTKSVCENQLSKWRLVVPILTSSLESRTYQRSLAPALVRES